MNKISVSRIFQKKLNEHFLLATDFVAKTLQISFLIAFRFISNGTELVGVLIEKKDANFKSFLQLSRMKQFFGQEKFLHEFISTYVNLGCQMTSQLQQEVQHTCTRHPMRVRAQSHSTVTPFGAIVQLRVSIHTFKKWQQLEF